MGKTKYPALASRNWQNQRSWKREIAAINNFEVWFMRLSRNMKFLLAAWVGKAVIALSTAGYAAIRKRSRKKQ